MKKYLYPTAPHLFMSSLSIYIQRYACRSKPLYDQSKFKENPFRYYLLVQSKVELTNVYQVIWNYRREWEKERKNKNSFEIDFDVYLSLLLKKRRKTFNCMTLSTCLTIWLTIGIDSLQFWNALIFTWKRHYTLYQMSSEMCQFCYKFQMENVW